MEIMDICKMKALRINKGFSQEVLALKAALSANFIGNIERGKCDITLGSLARIASALEVEICSLIKSKLEVFASEFIWNDDMDKYRMYQQIVYMLETFDKAEIAPIYLVIKLIFDSRIGAKTWMD